VKVRAIAKNTGVPAGKIRLLVDMVRGKTVEEGLNLLRFSPSPSAGIVAKAVKSAAASAENNYQMSAADLKIVSIYADEARTMQRYRPRSRGRVSPVKKRSSHITVIVSEQEG